MIPTGEIFAEAPLKKIKRERHDTSPDSLCESPRKKVKNEEKITLKTVLEEHNVMLDRQASYEKIDAFFKDLLTCSEQFSIEEAAKFIEHDITTILSQHSVKQYLKHNLEDYCRFLTIILDKFNDSDTISKFLHNEIIFNKSLVLENDFPKYFSNIILPKIINSLSEYNDNKLFDAACEVFRKCVLNKYSTEFEIYLNEILNLSDDKVDKQNTIKIIFKSLKSLKSDTPGINLMYKIIFQSLCRAYDFSVVYKFLIISLQFLGLDVSRDFECQKISKYLDSEEDLTKFLNVVSDILDVLKSNTTDLSCIVKDVSFSQFLENVLCSIFNLTKTPNVDCFKMMEFTIEIHPLLVEKKLNDFLIYSMRNTECGDYANFLLKIFETYAKLHRIQNLVSKMLPILNNSLENCAEFEEFYAFRGNTKCPPVTVGINFDNCLPDKVLDFSTECVVQMASWQGMNLFKTFLFHLEATVTDFINSNGEKNNSFLQILCKFSSWVLRSMRMAENTITETARGKFKTGMNEFRNILSKLGEALLNQEHNEVLVGAFLNLSYDWVELSIIFHYYNNEDDNFNAHSFLSTDQWLTLTQRITNFGETTCKNFMLRLLVQKLRSGYLFDNELNENIQRDIIQHISLNLRNDYKYIIKEKFLNEHLIEKLDIDTIINICELILSNEEIPGEIKNSKVFSNALIYTIFSKVFKKSKTLNVKLITSVDKRLFIEEEPCLITLKNNYEEILGDKLEVKNVNKIVDYLKLFKQLPVPYVSFKIQSIVLFWLFALHGNSNDNELRKTLEELITGILQVGKINLIELFHPESLMENITKNFENKEKLITLSIENVVKSEDSLKQFIPGVNYLLMNHEINDNLLNSIVILNELQKVIKSKPSKELKTLCNELKDLIIEKHFDIITNEAVDMRLIQSFVCCLKYKSNQDKKLEDLTEGYLDVVFNTKTDIIHKGCTSLFAIILHNKQMLNSHSNLPLKIWNFCKTKEVSHDDVQVFSQVLCLIFEHIPNEDFERVAEDLLSTTVEKLENRDFPEVSKYLERWSKVVTSSFNRIKSGKLEEILGKLLFKLDIFKNSIDFQRGTFDEIISFELAVIQQYQLHFTPTIIGMLLMSPIVLLRKNADFHYKFHKSTEYLEQLLKHRNSLIMDRLPAYLKIFRCLLELLCENCTNDMVENSDESARQLEKFMKHLVQHNKHIARIAPYLIADILQQYEKSTLNPKIKVHLNNCVYSLVPLCDHHAVSYLLRVLSTASRELFKIMYDNYKKFYRFTGKV